jgi:hypothetical protein
MGSEVVQAAKWTLVTIPVSNFADQAGKVDLASIEGISFGFNENDSMGTIYIDDIEFR